MHYQFAADLCIRKYIYKTLKIKIMSTKKLMIGVLAGTALGVVLGVLFAPDKGSTTRHRFSKKGFEYSDELEEKFNDLIDSITEQFQSVVAEVNEMAEKDRLKETKK